MGVEGVAPRKLTAADTHQGGGASEGWRVRFGADKRAWTGIDRLRGSGAEPRLGEFHADEGERGRGVFDDDFNLGLTHAVDKERKGEWVEQLLWGWHEGWHRHSVAVWAARVRAGYSGCGGSIVHGVGERRKESVIVKGEANKWVLCGKFKWI
jgi:hypothetical protein